LPYGVVVERTYIPENNGYTSKLSANTLDFVLEDNWLIKPYLRSMSSMTKDENELFERLKNEVKNSDGTLFIANCNLLQKFFRSHHIDNNHLIESGLALEAKEGMYDRN